MGGRIEGAGIRASGMCKGEVQAVRDLVGVVGQSGRELEFREWVGGALQRQQEKEQGGCASGERWK